ncbi:MAG: c-type cytochrome [Cyclobacteriaceae bacterium]
MKTYNKIPAIIFLLGLAVVALSFTSEIQDPKPWPVPESAKTMKNPVKNDSEAISIGKALYAKHCRSCHGKSGEGDGTKAAELETFPGDFTLPEFKAQTDGALFYKTSEGRDDMPSFNKKIPNSEDLWSLVHYLKTF